jgi:hypothetical protein
MNDRSGKPGPSPAVWARYAVLGLIVGGLWLWDSGGPLIVALVVTGLLGDRVADLDLYVAGWLAQRGTEPVARGHDDHVGVDHSPPH